MKAYVLIQTDASREPLATRLRAIGGVLSAEDLTGPFDGIALASSDSMENLIDHVVARIRQLPGVTRALPAPLIASATGPSVAEAWSMPNEAA